MAAAFVTSNSAFYDTYRIYREYIGFKRDYSYREWLRLPDNHKAAALYVQFYNEITLAWHKMSYSSPWAIEEEGVEEIDKYLMKNVEKIKADKKRFTPHYIYTVAKNCLYCKCIDPSKNKDRYYNETSNTFTSGDDELDWFDLVGESEDLESQFEFGRLQALIDSLEFELQMYIHYILGEMTEYQICCELKKHNLISGSVRNPEYRRYVLDYLDIWGKAKLRSVFSDYRYYTSIR